MLKVQEIRELIKLIDESSITDFTYEANGTKVKLKKSSGENVVVNRQIVEQPVEPIHMTPSAKSEQMEVAADKVEASEEKEQDKNEKTVDYDYEIKSPMVGTFYAAPSPEDPPYVQIGDKVDAKTVVCIVEAMKLFNEIEAEVSGEIVEILVENEELVEYGQPLFRVKK